MNYRLKNYFFQILARINTPYLFSLLACTRRFDSINYFQLSPMPTVRRKILPYPKQPFTPDTRVKSNWHTRVNPYKKTIAASSVYPRADCNHAVEMTSWVKMIIISTSFGSFELLLYANFTSAFEPIFSPNRCRSRISFFLISIEFNAYSKYFTITFALWSFYIYCFE